MFINIKRGRLFPSWWNVFLPSVFLERNNTFNDENAASPYDCFLNQEYGKENWRLEETRGNQQSPDEEIRGVSCRVGEGAADGTGGPGGKGESGRAPEETHRESTPTAPALWDRDFRISHWFSRIFCQIWKLHIFFLKKLKSLNWLSDVVASNS